MAEQKPKGIHQKLMEARKNIASSKKEKKGYNKFGKYYYFTPEQINGMVSEQCHSLGIFAKYDMTIEDGKHIATLELADLDKLDDKIVFTMPAPIPEITATNATQKVGGAVTFSKRYLNQIAFEIDDNSLDLDADNNHEEAQPKQKKQQSTKKAKPPLTPDSDDWKPTVKWLANGGDIFSISQKRTMTDEHMQQLVSEAGTIQNGNG